MRKALIILTFCIIEIILINPDVHALLSDALKEGISLYNKGKYSEAARKFNEARSDDHDSDVASFNLGAALYKQGKFRESIEAFNQALDTEDRELEAKTVYNIANSKFRMGEETAGTDPESAIALYREALDYYKRAIELDETNKDAKYNHEYAERQLKILLDRLRNQPPPDNKDNQNSGDKKKDQSRSSRQQNKNEDKKDSGQQKEAGGNKPHETKDKENKKGNQEGEHGKQDDNSAMKQPGKPYKMSPEEAIMLLDAFGREQGRKHDKKGGIPFNPDVLKDW